MKHCKKIFLLIIVLCLGGCQKTQVSDSNETEIGSDTVDIQSLLLPSDTKDSIEVTELRELVDTLPLASSITVATECKKCDVSLLARLGQRMRSLTNQDIYDLLCTIDNECSNNVEFVEIANNMVYQALLIYPRPMIVHLSRSDVFDNAFIYHQIETPILDYDFDNIAHNINKIEGYEEYKIRIIAAVRKGEQSL